MQSAPKPLREHIINTSACVTQLISVVRKLGVANRLPHPGSPRGGGGGLAVAWALTVRQAFTVAEV